LQRILAIMARPAFAVVVSLAMLALGRRLIGADPECPTNDGAGERRKHGPP
jgi:hypothetical protein